MPKKITVPGAGASVYNLVEQTQESWERFWQGDDAITAPVSSEAHSIQCVKKTGTYTGVNTPPSKVPRALRSGNKGAHHTEASPPACVRAGGRGGRGTYFNKV